MGGKILFPSFNLNPQESLGMRLAFTLASYSSQKWPCNRCFFLDHIGSLISDLTSIQSHPARQVYLVLNARPRQQTARQICCTAWSLLGLAGQNFAKLMFLTVSFLSFRMSLPAWKDSRLQDQKPYTSEPSSHDQQITYWYILMTWMIHQPLLWRVLHSLTTSVMLPIQHFYSLTILLFQRDLSSLKHCGCTEGTAIAVLKQY